MKNLRNVMLLFAASAAMIACQNNGKTAANAAGNDSAAADTVAVDTFFTREKSLVLTQVQSTH